MCVVVVGYSFLWRPYTTHKVAGTPSIAANKNRDRRNLPPFFPSSFTSPLLPKAPFSYTGSCCVSCVCLPPLLMSKQAVNANVASRGSVLLIGDRGLLSLSVELERAIFALCGYVYTYDTLRSACVMRMQVELFIRGSILEILPCAETRVWYFIPYQISVSGHVYGHTQQAHHRDIGISDHHRAIFPISNGRRAASVEHNLENGRKTANDKRRRHFPEVATA